MKKYVVFLAVLVITAVCCAGCVSDTVVGTWTTQDESDGTAFTETLVFKSDGTGIDTFTVDEFAAVLSITWKKGDDGSYLVTDNAGAELIYVYDAEKDQLYGGDSVFVRQ